MTTVTFQPQAVDPKPMSLLDQARLAVMAEAVSICEELSQWPTHRSIDLNRLVARARTAAIRAKYVSAGSHQHVRIIAGAGPRQRIRRKPSPAVQSDTPRSSTDAG